MPLTTADRENITDTLRTALQKVSPPMVFKATNNDSFELIGNKEVPYGASKKLIPGMYFASVVARKDMVSFYFFPCYTNPKEFNNVAPQLFKTLKGKTCFNIKKPEQVQATELNKLLKLGVAEWKKAGYMK